MESLLRCCRPRNHSGQPPAAERGSGNMQRAPDRKEAFFQPNQSKRRRGARTNTRLLSNPPVGNGARARLPTVRDKELGGLLSRSGLRAQELQQFGVDFLCMGPRNAVRTTLDDHQART
jgi:hypothetical protein